jgi:hypothetical protein
MNMAQREIKPVYREAFACVVNIANLAISSKTRVSCAVDDTRKISGFRPPARGHLTMD